LAVLGIVIFHKFIDNWFNFPYKALNYLWSIVAVSISAQLAIGLLSVYYFHSFPVLFPLSNIVVILFAGIELTLGFSFVVFSGIDFLAKPIAYCLDILISYELLILKSIGALPYSLINNIYMSIQEFLLMYFVVLSLSYFFIANKIRGLYLGFIGIVLLGVFYIWESREVSKQDKVVLFGSNDICLAYLKRDTAFIYLSDKVNKKAFAFYAEPYIRSSGCSVFLYIGAGNHYSNLVSLKENGLIRIKNKYYQPFSPKFTAKKTATQLVTKYQVRKFIAWNKKKEFDAIFLSEDSYDGIMGSSKFQVVHDFNVN
jgi:competence protein ComEC